MSRVAVERGQPGRLVGRRRRHSARGRRGDRPQRDRSRLPGNRGNLREAGPAGDRRPRVAVRGHQVDPCPGRRDMGPRGRRSDRQYDRFRSFRPADPRHLARWWRASASGGAVQGQGAASGAGYQDQLLRSSSARPTRLATSASRSRWIADLGRRRSRGAPLASGGGRPFWRPRSDVEPEAQHLAVPNDVVTSLLAQLARLAHPGLAAVTHEILTIRDLGTDEAALEVAVDHPGRVDRLGAALDRPRPRLLGPRGEERDQIEQ